MLNSPAEDFSKTTLASVSGTLGKLQYLAGLRQNDGEYFHWGMARRHGEANARTAIAQAHTDLFLTALRTPVRNLWEEAKSAADDQSTDVREYVGGLMESQEALIPPELRGGTRRHFNSVLVGLCCLAGVETKKSDLTA